MTHYHKVCIGEGSQSSVTTRPVSGYCMDDMCPEERMRRLLKQAYEIVPRARYPKGDHTRSTWMAKVERLLGIGGSKG